MSWNPALDPHCPTGDEVDAIETLIAPRARDIGGFEVRRALPSAKRQMVGPFIFFDQMGPAEFLTDQGIDVRPHPHIGLATVTYLFDGSIHHRDSLGNSEEIHPESVNWMVAGRGITHSERTASDVRKQEKSRLFGIQTWVALPEKDEERPASFEHHGKEALPVVEAEGVKARLILGSAFGERAPASVFSDTMYAAIELQPGALMPLDAEHEDRAIYILSGAVQIGGQRFEAGQMMIFRPGDRLAVKAAEATRLMLLGGETLNGPRYIWWNFVASSREKIEAAKEAWRAGDWENGRFHLPPDDKDEFIPAPER